MYFHDGLEGIRRWCANNLFLMPLLGALCLALLFLFGAYQLQQDMLQHESERNRVEVEKRVVEAANDLSQLMNLRLNLTSSLAAFVTINRDFSQPEFDRFGALLQKDLQGVRSLQLAPDGVVAYLTNLEQNRKALGHNLFADERRRATVERAVRENRYIISGPIKLIQGGEAIIARRPLYFDDPTSSESKFWGFATVLIDVEQLMADAHFGVLEQDLELSIRGRDGLGALGEVFYGAPSIFDDPLAMADVRLADDSSWQVAAVARIVIHPTGFIYSSGYWLIGWLAALLIAVTSYSIIIRPRKLLQQVQLATSNLRTTLDSIGDAVVATDTRSCIVRMNPEAEKLTGWGFSEAKGRPLTEVFQVIYAEDEITSNNLILNGESHIEGMTNYRRLLSRQGEEYHITESVAPIRDDSDKVIGVVLVFRNVTDEYAVKLALEESEERLRTMFESSLDAYAVFQDGLHCMVNTAYLGMFGYPLDEDLIGKPMLDCLASPQIEETTQELSIVDGSEILSGGYETIGRHQDGSIFRLDVRVSSYWLKDEEYFFYILRDITARKQAEEERRKLSRAVESSSSVVIITDLKGVIEYVNPKFSEVTGYTRDEVIGLSPRLLKSGESDSSVYADLWATISSGGEWKGELHNRKKDGSFYWARDSISGVKNSQGQITHYIGIQDDVTHEFELHERLGFQASHDNLTGLINRHEFERRAERLLASPTLDNEEHAICFMDLDQFKVINDSCGHTAGDELLRQMGQALQDGIRRRDTLARLGGDEFAVLMEHCSLDHAHGVAMTLLKTVQNFQFSWEGQSFRVGVSIGLVAINGGVSSLTELIKQADAACYMAKDLGRNRIHIYRPDDTELALRHGQMQWVARINQAEIDDRYCLYAQPIVSLTNANERHYELLVRMIGEQGELIPPGAFLPAAERYSLIEKLDTWVVKNAFSLLEAHPDFVQSIDFVAINLSGPTLTNDTFLSDIMRRLKLSGIPPSKLCFEVTETVAISNLSTAINFISTLRKLGCRFALDDFGSGLSSFGYLKNLPVDYLKIDGMFVKDIVDDPIDYAMVKSINDIGQVMGMQTIAEFVESDEIKALLIEIGVNYAQGFGVGKPVPFTQLLESESFAGSEG